MAWELIAHPASMVAAVLMIQMVVISLITKGIRTR